MKRNIVLCVFALAILLGSFSVGHTVCTVTGRISQIVAPATGAVTVYVSEGPSLGYVFYFYISTGYSIPNLLGAVESAVSSEAKKVIITGNAATCPTTGSTRYGGYATTMSVNP
ncbi:MAG: hypothetical protein A4E62_02801 [Syntrophorhabdus sp. PtaU1.Bin002]|nr:MAG: hypothetical protein A4E62_02801 [Syntrophorhabdus sp. PtaU1.Bin002]